ncbi:alanine racemase [Paenibacillus gansuensis]|uniref:Alanine racemase n=1 Tax=Paenibacillus gansuensis TaxID=306542 RepID=A0ABW5P7L7_9BACL
MEDYYRQTRVEIDLDALDHNLNEFRRTILPGQKILASVKANAYGHGAVGIARAAERWGIDYAGVAFLDEAIELRNAGVQVPILVLGYTPPEGIPAALEHNITLNVFHEDLLTAAAKLASAERPLKVHLKVDTGMGRLGVLADGEAVPFVEKAVSIPEIMVEGLFTHFASADEADKEYTYSQYAKFKQVIDELEAKGIRIPLIHAGNSAAGIDLPELSCSMVRLGIAMYGLYPSEEVDKNKVKLKPVMSFKTALTHIKTLPPGSGISYGTIYHTDGEALIGTLPVGYADGFSRMATGKAEALIRGHKLPVVGRICMDQCMVNLTGLPEEVKASLRVGEEAVIMGTQGDACISAEEIALHLGTINYELTCMVANRVPRVFLRGGKAAAVRNSLR